MTEQEAREILQKFREKDDDTGEEYGYIIQECCGKDETGYVFRCSLPLMAVYPDGTVLNTPI